MIIYLIGMSGVGKTTIGKQIASQINYQFIDLDSTIESSTKLSISEIFDTHGEKYFRKKEQEELHKTFTFQNAFIATGGGIPFFYNNMDLMNQKGKTVYLKLNPLVIYDRFSNNDKLTRPLLKKVRRISLNYSKKEKIFINKHLYKLM